MYDQLLKETQKIAALIESATLKQDIKGTKDGKSITFKAGQVCDYSTVTDSSTGQKVATLKFQDGGNAHVLVKDADKYLALA